MRAARLGIALLLVLFAGSALPGCRSCSREAPKQKNRSRPLDIQECAAPEDCADENPCTIETCERDKCVSTPVAENTSCDDGNVCDGVARCDAEGRCVQGAAPAIDDGNACTTDSCDPVRGPAHEPVQIDDSDECTKDACDPATGRITHDSVEIDDGNDCTFDSCDPKQGVKHQQPNPFYTCQSDCGAGFHVVSRTRSPQCGSPAGPQTYCAPDCGNSFYACDSKCPKGYRAAATNTNTQCGDRSSPQVFCVRE